MFKLLDSAHIFINIYKKKILKLKISLNNSKGLKYLENYTMYKKLGNYFTFKYIMSIFSSIYILLLLQFSNNNKI